VLYFWYTPARFVQTEEIKRGMVMKIQKTSALIASLISILGFGVAAYFVNSQTLSYQTIVESFDALYVMYIIAMLFIIGLYIL
jgi:hypothetical protein